jgi:RsiW-degrading membrane proteinase PrsW (M82 family)
MIAVGPIEEGAKLIVPAALVLVLTPRRLADGLVLGVASGAGSRCWRRWATRSSS